jgi:pyruvate dehydrogenase E2 component (dihydrolipoamide acetyltransferase)
MPVDITMPQLSDTMTEGTVVKWYKNEGDKVKEGEKLADIETDKAVMEMESFATGVMAVRLVEEKGKVTVGTRLAVVATGKEDPAQVKKQASAAAPAVKSADTAKPAEPAPAGGMAPAAPAVAAPAVAVQAPAAPAAAPEAEASAEDANGQRQRVSPLAKRIAQENRVDLSLVQGTGPQGRIIERDVTAFLAAPPPAVMAPVAAPSAVFIEPGKTLVVPMSKMRQAIAKNLVTSKQTIPHYYTTIDVDVQELVGLRERLNAILEPQKIRLSLSDLLFRGLATALLKHPVVNATFDGQNVTRYGDVNLGMAVSVPDGLIVPILRNVNRMGLLEIRRRTADLVDRARANRLKQDEMRGATFSVSNLGSYGVREFSAIINPPQVAILAIAAAQKRPVVRGESVVVRTMLTLTLSADHRVVDGAEGADFLRSLKGVLEEPGTMLL